MTIQKDTLEFWGRIEQATGKSGLTKSEIARRGGFHRQNLSTRNAMPSLATLIGFCKVTGASADWLLGLEAER